jgi:hypothetical protein
VPSSFLIYLAAADKFIGNKFEQAMPGPKAGGQEARNKAPNKSLFHQSG